MGKTIFFNFLIFAVVLSEGIGTLSGENIKQSFDLHVRRKRVVDLTRKRSKPVPLEKASFIVSLQRNGESICTANILSPTVVITAAHCFEIYDKYWILSGSSYNDRAIHHNITQIIFHPDYRPENFPHDLALLIISPPFDLESSPNRKIMLYDGDVAPGTLGTISGWGSTSLKRLSYPKIFRSITVPIISQEVCQNESRQIEITDKNICTWYKSGQKCCGSGDSGSPLVVYGQLAGVYSGCVGHRSFFNYPDIFMKVSNPEYRHWIISKIPDYPYNPYNRQITI